MSRHTNSVNSRVVNNVELCPIMAFNLWIFVLVAMVLVLT